MWDFSPGNKERIKAILAGDANLQGPHLPLLQPQAEPGGGGRTSHAGTHRGEALPGRSIPAHRHHLCPGIGRLSSGRKGDEVIVPAYTFFATPRTVVGASQCDPRDRRCGRKPVPGSRGRREAGSQEAPRRSCPCGCAERKHTGPDGRVTGHRASRKGVSGRRRRGPGGRRIVPRQAARQPGNARLLQLRLLQDSRQRRGGLRHNKRRMALHPGRKAGTTRRPAGGPTALRGERKAGELFCGENYRMSQCKAEPSPCRQIRKTDQMLAGYQACVSADQRRDRQVPVRPIPPPYRRARRHGHLPDPVPAQLRGDSPGD